MILIIMIINTYKILVDDRGKDQFAREVIL